MQKYTYAEPTRAKLRFNSRLVRHLITVPAVQRRGVVHADGINTTSPSAPFTPALPPQISQLTP